MGFGGINTHIVLGGQGQSNSQALSPKESMLMASAQDAELFLFRAADIPALKQQAQTLQNFAAQLSLAELTDLAVHLYQELDQGPVRAALVASTPEELAYKLATLQEWLNDGQIQKLDTGANIYLGQGHTIPNLGYLFPGQGTHFHRDAGALGRRFSFIPALYSNFYEEGHFALNGHNHQATHIAQPAIVTASLAGLRILDRLGIQAKVGVGHSLGEISALYWAGAMTEDDLIQLAKMRGQVMQDLGHPTGAMATIRAGQETVRALLNGENVSIACLNAPQQTVISGEEAEVAKVVARAQGLGHQAKNIPVSHAFHSPLVEAAAQPLADYVAQQSYRPLEKTVISTITGAALKPDADLTSLLYQQVTKPVRFTDAVTEAAVDLWLEVGSGHTLNHLASEFVDVPIISLDASGSSLSGLLQATGAVFALGGPVQLEVLFADRFARPFDLNWQANFLTNPCELAPLPADENVYQTPQPILNGKPEPVNPAKQDTASEKSEDPVALVQQLVAERLELPLAAVDLQDRLLSDLHLNSISVGQLVADAARKLGLSAPNAPTEFADATVAELAETLLDLSQNGLHEANGAEVGLPMGVDTWVRSYEIVWTAQALPPTSAQLGSGEWEIIAPEGQALQDSLSKSLAQVDGKGMVVCLPNPAQTTALSLLLKGAKMALADKDKTHFVLIQNGSGGTAFVRTLKQEAPHLKVCVLDMPFDHAQVSAWVAAEVTAAPSYVEARYDSAGQRWQAGWRILDQLSPNPNLPLNGQDVLLVTGGGKGITAECALSLARDSGVKLALLGRSKPEDDSELALNLERMTKAGIAYRYFAVDVTDAEVIKQTVGDINNSLGPITAILHGAARNVPKRLLDLDVNTIEQTLAPKVLGLQNLLAVINPEQLRFCIGFGSIIAEIGLPGEADYGLANEWLGRLLSDYQRKHPQCQCLTIAWSVWGSVGMGARLGILETLMQQGITPIPLDTGVSMLKNLLGHISELPPTVVVTGRFGQPETVRLADSPLPFQRFLEENRLYYPGVELVVEATLSTETDPYVNDHIFQGERLFLAVMGLEAMAQVAMALVETDTPPTFKNLALNRPIVIPRQGGVKIRLAALKKPNGQVQVVIRSEETGFQVEHFQVTCRFEENLTPHDYLADLDMPTSWQDFPTLDLDPDNELYGHLFFHQGRFKQVENYRYLSAQGCLAQLKPADGRPWFNRYLPQSLVLGDPASRDATIHAIQACVPQATLLPVSVEQIIPNPHNTQGAYYVQALERPTSATDDTLVFDVLVRDAEGMVKEIWRDLKLKMMAGTDFLGPWPAPILGAYLERYLQSTFQQTLSLSLSRDKTHKRQDRSQLAWQRAIGQAIEVLHRPDGKPEGPTGWSLSAAHHQNWVLAVANANDTSALGCDMEAVVARSNEQWSDLLGATGFSLATLTSQEATEDLQTSATRIWMARECLRKAGASLQAPLSLDQTSDTGWVSFASGECIVLTFIAQLQEQSESLVLAVLVEQEKEAV